jgi:hypothetical protein
MMFFAMVLILGMYSCNKSCERQTDFCIKMLTDPAVSAEVKLQLVSTDPRGVRGVCADIEEGLR